MKRRIGSLSALGLLLLATVASAQTQQQWDTGLKAFKAGDSANIAIQNIWQITPPPGNLNNVAVVVAAIYANDYWDTTQMSVSKLAGNLQSAIGVNQSDATRAATYAFSRWHGLLVRANFSDMGVIPRSGSVTASPDVVINGQNQLTNVSIIQNWNKSMWSPAVNLKNYVYGRAQSSSIGVPIVNPVMSGYYSDQGMAPPPQTWVRMNTYDNIGMTAKLLDVNGSGTIQPGIRCANGGNEGFGFNVPGTGHYCLIILAQSEFFSNDPLSGGTNWDNMTWITNNGAAGWHNVNVTSAGSYNLAYYNHDDAPATFSFRVNANKLPKGSSVAIEASHPELRSLAGKLTARGPHSNTTVTATLPPKHKGKLRVHIKTPDGGVLPGSSSVEVAQFWHITPDNEHYVEAAAKYGRLPFVPEGAADQGAYGRLHVRGQGLRQVVQACVPVNRFGWRAGLRRAILLLDWRANLPVAPRFVCSRRHLDVATKPPRRFLMTAQLCSLRSLLLLVLALPTVASAQSVQQQAWATGLKAFQSGEPATTAIADIWDEMKPPGDLDLLAKGRWGHLRQQVLGHNHHGPGEVVWRHPISARHLRKGRGQGGQLRVCCVVRAVGASQLER